MNKFKITELKHSQLSTGKLKKNFNALMKEPEKVPDWQTTEITYFLPKLGDSKKVRNYRPITCLTTTYKALREIIDKRISTHLEEQNLLPAEKCMDNCQVTQMKSLWVLNSHIGG
jgi:hypothetical protein